MKYKNIFLCMGVLGMAIPCMINENSKANINQIIEHVSSETEHDDQGFTRRVKKEANWYDNLVFGKLTYKDKDKTGADIDVPLMGIRMKFFEITGHGDEEVASCVSDWDGSYQVKIDKLGMRRIYVKIIAEDNYIKIKDSYNSDKVYEYNSIGEEDGIIRYMPFYQWDIKFDLNTRLGKGFSVFNAAHLYSQYARNTFGDNYFSRKALNIYYPCLDKEDSSAFYSSSRGCICLKSGNSYYNNWDTIGHEFGHYVTDKLGMRDSPGGTHYGNSNYFDYITSAAAGDNRKGYYEGAVDASRLTYNEGLASFYSFIAQDHFKNIIGNLQYCCDLEYKGFSGCFDMVNDSAFSDNGLWCEECVTGVMWNLYDSNNIGDDNVTLTEEEIWRALTINKPKRLYNFLENIYDLGVDRDDVGLILDHYHITASGLDITGGYYMDESPTFTFKAYGGSKTLPNNMFKLRFLSFSYGVLHETDVLYHTYYTMPFDKWEHIVKYAQYGCFYVQILSAPSVDGTAFGIYEGQYYYFNVPTRKKKNFTLNASESTLDAQYFFYTKNKTVTIGNVDLKQTYLRTGFIENKYINLSPRRSGAGKASYQVEFLPNTYRIYNVSIDLAAWSQADKNQIMDSKTTAKLMTLCSSDGITYDWVDYEPYKDLKTISLKNAPSMSTLNITSNMYGIRGFKIEMTSEATGSKNGARLSISKITIC